MAKLSLSQMRTLKKHSEHHSKKHMDMMKKLMREGSSFKAAHKKAQKDFLLAFCLGESPVFLVTGACKFPPVALLYFARPEAVRPPVWSLSFLVKDTFLDMKNVSYLKYNTITQSLNYFFFFFCVGN